MDREQRTIKAIAEAIARGECPPRTTPREWTNFEKQAKAVFYDLVLTVQLHDDDDEAPAKARGDVLTFDQAEQALCAAYGRGWRATAATFMSPAKVGGDEREAFEVAMRETYRMIDPLNPPPAGSYYRGEHNGIIAALKTMRENFDRAALSADGGKDKRDAERYRWLREEDNDELVLQRGPVDKSYVYLPRLAKLDEMIDAAIAANQAKEDA